MPVTLRFDTPLDTTHPVDLTFGAPASAVGDAYLNLNAELPAPILGGYIAHVRQLSQAATLPAPMLDAVLFIDNAVYRGPGSRTISPWQVAAIANAYTTTVMQDSLPLPAIAVSPWQEATDLQSASRSVLQSGLPLPRDLTTAWQDGVPVGLDVRFTFESMLRLRNRIAAFWNNGIAMGSDITMPWQDRLHVPRVERVSPWQNGIHAGRDTTTSAGVGVKFPKQWHTRWQEARKPLPGHFGTVTPPTPHVCYTPPPGGAVPLRFAKHVYLGNDLLFICNDTPVVVIPATVVVPIKRVYIVINDAHLIRVDGNIELPVYGMSLTIDMDSWTWGFSATLPATQLANLEPGGPGDPVELQATINGVPYLLLAENITRDRQFAKSTITVSGRGISAVLADPYSPILTFASAAERTAQQLMNEALMFNGVTLGWDVDWRINDWIVPANVWSHQGTYMSAVTAIAGAAGAFIQPDPVDMILRVRPCYPSAPWDWAAATPDLELPAAVITKESIAWAEKPQYNLVYVSGTTTGGVLGQVKRAGTAGDLPAPMVTDALITTADAARQRGLPVLANTGRIATYSLSLPVLDETGIIDPGTLVRYVDNGIPYTGVVRGVSVNVGLPGIRQTIEVETHP